MFLSRAWQGQVNLRFVRFVGVCFMGPFVRFRFSDFGSGVREPWPQILRGLSSRVSACVVCMV